MSGSAGRKSAKTGSSLYRKSTTLPLRTSKSSTPRNLPFEPALVTSVVPPGFFTGTGAGTPSWVWPPSIASSPRTREASFRSTSMPLCDSSTTACAPLPRAASMTCCRFSSWMPKVQSGTK
ncbi:hypothetical protein D3C72_1885670 [compost metagenome]